jgi:hypothetical protein
MAMRLVRVLLCSAILSLPVAACGKHSSEQMKGDPVAASGSGGARTFTVSGFDKVDLRGSDDVDVQNGPNFAVRAEGDAAMLDELDIRKDGDTLRIGRKPGNWKDSKGVVVHVTLPRLTAASLGGSGDMKIAQAEGDFSGALGGSGNLSIAQIRGGKVDLSLAGTGDLNAAGTAETLSASVAGTGDLDAAGLKVKTADLTTAGTGGIKANVSGQASVSMVGTGDVTVTGGAKCSIQHLGTGEAHCG